MDRPLTEADRDEHAQFLTARYRLFTVIAGRLATPNIPSGRYAAPGCFT
jgi:uncharacterized protein